MPENIEKIIGNHPLIKDVRRRIRRIAPQNNNVFLCGEAGTEKTTAGKLIHIKSLISRTRLEIVNCCAYIDADDTVLKNRFNELFQDIYTGTLFLNNIEFLSSGLQRELLRLIVSSEERTGNSNLSNKIRIISDTCDSDCFSRNGFLRELSLRLNEYTIKIPSIKDRKQDIPLLIDYYLSRGTVNLELQEKPSIPDYLMKSFIRYEWKGNIRELKTTVDLIIEQIPEGGITSAELPFIIEPDPMAFLKQYEYHEAVENVEKYLILNALDKFGWNRTRAAGFLGMTEGNIRQKIKKLGLIKD